MDRSFVAYPSQSQPPQQQQQQSRRPKNDSFRPALRFPTDPHKPSSLPQKIQHIVAPAPAAILLQSRRKPWEVDSTRLEDLVASTAHARKVIVILGDAPSAALEPIVTSGYLSGSLVIVIAHAESDFSISPQQCVPAVRILRLRPKPAANLSPQQPRPAPEALAESQSLSASRLNAVLDWADRVGSAWRANPVGQTMFATLQEGEGPSDGIGGSGSGKPWKWRSKTNLKGPTYTTVYDVSDGDGSLVPWAARFALNSRSNSSSVGSGASSNTSSIFIVDTPNSETARPSFSSSTGGGKFVRNAMSTSNLATSDRDRSFDQALSATRRPGTSHAGHRSVPPLSKSLTPPETQKRRFSLISFARGKMYPEISGSMSSKKAARPSFDALINFLPPSSATGVEGTLGRGAIATNHALAAHNKLLLKQTILVTTAVQRFLVPVTPRGSGRSPGEGRFGGVTRGRTSEGGLGDDRQAKKRWSVALIGSLFGVGDPVPSSKALGKRSVLPTPPGSRPSSSEESGGGHGKRPSLGRVGTSVSAVSASTQGPYPLPKLIHVLPYGPGHASTPAGPGTARLVRNLEAFLLSWSFGGPKFGEEADDSGAEGASSSTPGKRTVRPFLLDLAGMTDVLKAQLPEGEVEWPLADLILSGALDDEYPCTGGSPAETPSSIPTPDVVVTRASSDARSPTGSNFPHGRTASGSKPKYGNDGLTLDSTPGPMEESWAARRAWLSGVGDLAIYPMAEGLGLIASPTGSNPPSRPTSTASERSRTRSLGGPPPSRPRVSIGGVTASSSSPAVSPQLQTPPPPLPSKTSYPTSPSSTKPGQSRARILSHSRSQSSSTPPPPVPPLPPSPQETFGSPPPPAIFNNGRSNFPSENARYTRNPVPRPPQPSSLDSEDRPRYYSISDHGHGSPSRNPPPPSTFSDLRRGKSGSAGSAASPVVSSTPIAAAFSRSQQRDEFGAAAPPTSWNAGTWGTSSSASSHQVSSPSASLPSRSSMKNSEYTSSPAPRTPARGVTTPQRGGESWYDDSSNMTSRRPSILRKKSTDDRDRRYPSDPPPPPHPSFTSSPKYPGSGRRPSGDNQPYFTGYDIAPPPLPAPPPPRPSRPAPPGVTSKDGRNRSTSSPLKHGVSAEGLNNHRPRPGTGGSVIDKRLPITPPDSASSSEVSNDMDMGGRTSDREDKRKWWATPTRVSARLI